MGFQGLEFSAGGSRSPGLQRVVLHFISML